MLDEIIQIVKEAGQIMLKAHNIQEKVQSKVGRANFVTKYDVEVQQYLYGRLSELYPDAVFIGEEDTKQERDRRLCEVPYCFIIDPIDGTTNFIMDYHHSAISVALLSHGETAAGIVYDPYLEEVFYAARGRGAYLNGTPLKLHNLPLGDGLVAMGASPYYREKTQETFRLAAALFDRALDIRRSGSAALDICYVAAGRYVLFYELLLSPWDYAAASLILTEAGGCISSMDHQPISFTEGSSILAATPAAYEEFFQITVE